MVSEPPHVGRERELALLKERLEMAMEGSGSLVLVGGEAGIGKSRLCNEFASTASMSGFVVLIGRSLPGVPAPYLPFQAAFATYLRKTTRTEAVRSKRLKTSIKRLAPEIMGATPFVGGGLKLIVSLYREYRDVSLNTESGPALTPRSAMDTRTLHESLDLLEKLGSKNPILLVIEDLHWADSASTQMLVFLARNVLGLRLMILGTYRSEELMTGADGKEPSLAESLRIMRREGICHEIQLEGLNRDQLQVAIEGMLGGQLEKALLDRIIEESGGSPLFTVETLRLLVQTGSIHVENRTWMAKSDIKIEVPSSVREVILGRIGQIAEKDRRILDCASVMGAEFDPDILSEVLHVDRLSLLEELDSINRHSQLIRPLEGAYIFTHEKIRRVINDGISPLRRRELHRVIGEVMEKGLTAKKAYAELSFHFYESQQKKKCVEYSLLTGEVCVKRGAPREAMTYFQRTIEMAGDDSRLLEEKLKAVEGYGDSCFSLGMYDTAIAAYNRYLETAPRPKDRARVLRKSAEFEWRQRFSLQRTMQLLDRAEESGELEPVEKGLIMRTRASALLFLGKMEDLEEAGRLFSQAEKLLDENGAVGELAESLYFHIVLFSVQCRYDEFHSTSARAEKLYLSLGTPTADLMAMNIRGWDQIYSGQYDSALEDFSKASQAWAKLGDYEGVSGSHFSRSRVFYLRDDFESARQEVLKGLALASRQEGKLVLASLKIQLSLIETRLGIIDEAKRHLREVLAFLDSVEKESGESVMHRLAEYSWSTLADAEVSVAESDLNQSSGKYLASLRAFEEFLPGWKQVAITRFAQALVKQGNYAKASEYFQKASQIYQKMGNPHEVERLSKLVNNLSHKPPTVS
jgi:tetratricopeptide (TPR) repeat protein